MMLDEAEKLARIRAKYPARKMKKAPIIVEAKPLDLALKARLADTAFEEFEKTAKEWVGNATIAYLRRRGTVDFFDDDALTEAEILMMQFYAGDRPLPEKDEICDVVLPRVDRYDQAIARRDVLMELLSPSWRMLEREIKVEDCARKAFPLIATFTLTADNVNIEKAEARVAVAFIFRLMAHCDGDLLDEYFPSDGCVSANFASYLQAIDCQLSVFNRMIAHVMKQLASAQQNDA
ncbi:unnamed protein product [Toxocara canis]|uniref:Type I restriction endonuclease subunit R n=1 Tax=Toxocara canis TaxID=6265 RepID=A0A183U0K8_TOXCA|nr:unnamed protein product [Toxocara canis]